MGTPPRSNMKFLLLVLTLWASASVASNRVNKHTYSSNDGEGDYKFISTYFCDADTDSSDKKCAVDMKASCAGFDVHMVQSFVTANGTETPDEWYSYISALHGDVSHGPICCTVVSVAAMLTPIAVSVGSEELRTVAAREISSSETVRTWESG